jgi:acyl-homoserine lactone synthase
MIHIVTAGNRHLYRAELAQMHRLRKAHFIEERGWADLKVIDGGEYDEYDDERAVYFMGFNLEGEVIAGARARPTDDKCMLADVFPDLIGMDYPPVRGSDVWELTRVFTTKAARDFKRQTGRGLAMEVLLAIMEWVQDGGVDRIVGVMDLDRFAGSRASGWNISMTGLPMDSRDGPYIGFDIACTAADIEAMRQRYGRTGRAGYAVVDEDIAAFGDLEKIEAEFTLVQADGRPMPRGASLVEQRRSVRG